ncbi:MAG TPA: SDR family oxidoreductase [Acidimicrobiia bacterium]|nr:SDR family oxidoreductase [Acidimicrobiia bacterium]
MLVTGASGLLGRHLQRSDAIDRWELIAPGSGTLDIRTRDRVVDFIHEWKPDVVVHLAYRKHDRRCIVDGSRNVAEGATACGARLIHFSTDAVFAGRDAPYSEADTPVPFSEYGRMKWEAEKAVVAACPPAVIVRTSLMYGTDMLAATQIDVRNALDGGRAMTFYTDEYRCPAHAADVATAIGALAIRRDVTGPVHVAGPEALSRAEYARAIATWFGFDAHRLHTGRIADTGVDRPGRVVLDSSLAASLGIRCRPMAEALR